MTQEKDALLNQQYQTVMARLKDIEHEYNIDVPYPFIGDELDPTQLLYNDHQQLVGIRADDVEEWHNEDDPLVTYRTEVFCQEPKHVNPKKTKLGLESHTVVRYTESLCEDEIDITVIGDYDVHGKLYDILVNVETETDNQFEDLLYSEGLVVHTNKGPFERIVQHNGYFTVGLKEKEEGFYYPTEDESEFAASVRYRMEKDQDDLTHPGYVKIHVYDQRGVEHTLQLPLECATPRDEIDFILEDLL